jgi:MoaA/NifB/PqqE/SkfB family radical SAM enzyme
MLDEIKKFYRDAKELGFFMNFLWGGEPLLRKDIPEILRFSKRMDFINVVTTNGWFLEDRIDEIAPYVDSFIVSLDHPSEIHDEIRGREGLFQRLVRGIQLIKRKYQGIKVMLNFLLTNRNKDAIEDSVNLAEGLGVSIYVCPMEIDLLRSGDMKGIKKHLKPSKEEEARVAETLIQLKRRGFQVNNSYLYLESIKDGKSPYRCHFPKMVLQVGPEGEVIDCRAWDRPVGWVRQQGLKEIYRNKRLRDLAGLEGEQCNKCINPNRIDLSYFWELRFEPVTSIFKMFLGA